MTPDDWSALGTRMGSLAWTAFPFIVLAAMLLALLAGSLGLAWRRRTRPEPDAPPQLGRLVPGLVIGFLLIVGLASLFTLFARHLGEGRPMGRMDDALSMAVGTHTPDWARQAFSVFTHIGDPLPVATFVLLFALFLRLRGHPGFAWGWLLANAGNAVLNYSLKQIFERVRPVHDTLLVNATGFSFPSGHSSAAIVLWGMLAYLCLRIGPKGLRLPMLALAAAMAVAVPASRVFLQAHFLTDVVAGLCSGAAWLAISIVSAESARHRRRARLYVPAA